MNARFCIVAGLIGVTLGLPASATEDAAVVLRRQTQELLDAVTNGSVAVWERYLDTEAIYTDEGGAVMSRSQMLQQIKPLPQGVSGIIEVIEFKVAVRGSIAVTNHLDDEHETFHGHKLHCQYRTTDTWWKTRGGWRLIGGQVLALKTDPPPVPLTQQQLDEYSGRYALTPEIVYEIRTRKGALEGQQTGRPSEALLAEVADILFVPGKPRYRKVFLRGPDGQVTGFAERREAWDLIWTRLP